ncbi:hypothetical protein JL720_6726 [Aureococcus anophagefferens]|nr:hypothetical protein JL720_6726 [Aureococcus anophagefferens]
MEAYLQENARALAARCSAQAPPPSGVDPRRFPASGARAPPSSRRAACRGRAGTRAMGAAGSVEKTLQNVPNLLTKEQCGELASSHGVTVNERMFAILSNKEGLIPSPPSSATASSTPSPRTRGRDAAAPGEARGAAGRQEGRPRGHAARVHGRAGARPAPGGASRPSMGGGERAAAAAAGRWRALATRAPPRRERKASCVFDSMPKRKRQPTVVEQRLRASSTTTRSAPPVESALQKWWKASARYDDKDRDGALNKPERGAGALREVPRIFQLADQWTDSIDAEHYCSFLHKAYDIVYKEMIESDAIRPPAEWTAAMKAVVEFMAEMYRLKIAPPAEGDAKPSKKAAQKARDATLCRFVLGEMAKRFGAADKRDGSGKQLQELTNTILAVIEKPPTMGGDKGGLQVFLMLLFAQLVGFHTLEPPRRQGALMATLLKNAPFDTESAAFGQAMESAFRSIVLHIANTPCVEMAEFLTLVAAGFVAAHARQRG